MSDIIITKTNISKENELKRNEWLKHQTIVNLPVENIFLKEKIHKEAKVNFTKQIERLKNKEITMLNNPVIVKDEGNNQYSLVTGYKGYVMAKTLNHELIPAVIVNSDRKDYINEVGYKKRFAWININEIIIPKAFLNKKVTREKIQKCLSYYEEHGRMDKPVTIQGKRLCIDGYSRLVASKILKLKKVFCEFN